MTSGVRIEVRRTRATQRKICKDGCRSRNLKRESKELESGVADPGRQEACSAWLQRMSLLSEAPSHA